MRELRLMPHGTFIYDLHFGLCRLVSKAGGVATVECKQGTDTIERPLFFVAFELPNFPGWAEYDEANFEYSVLPGYCINKLISGVEFWNYSRGWQPYKAYYSAHTLFCRRPRPKPVVAKLSTYAERQAAWIAKVDLKPGDKVKVLESCDSHENGWDNSWPDHMNKYVGKVLTVGFRPDNDCSTGIPLIVDELIGAEMHFPYFVLMHHNEAFAEAA